MEKHALLALFLKTEKKLFFYYNLSQPPHIYFCFCLVTSAPLVCVFFFFCKSSTFKPFSDNTLKTEQQKKSWKCELSRRIAGQLLESKFDRADQAQTVSNWIIFANFIARQSAAVRACLNGWTAFSFCLISGLISFETDIFLLFCFSNSRWEKELTNYSWTVSNGDFGVRFGQFFKFSTLKIYRWKARVAI